MTRRGLVVVACLGAVLAGCGGASTNGDVIASFPVSGTGSTPHFIPPGAWELQYSWDCARVSAQEMPGAHGIDLVVYNADDDSTSFEHPETQSTKTHGSGVLTYKRPGPYYVMAQTQCDWQVSVVDRS